MSLILSGSDGLSDVDGTAATPAIRGTDANTGIFFPAADTIGFAEGGAEAMRIDSSGNVGIGTSSPTSRLHVVNSAGNCIEILDGQNATAKGAYITLRKGGTDTSYIGQASAILGGASTSNDLLLWAEGSTNQLFYTNGTERARIDSSGNLLVGATAQSPNNNGFQVSPAGNGAGIPFVVSAGNSSSNNEITSAVYSTSAAQYQFYVGYGGTVYARNATISTLSDRRLKENIVDLDVGLDKIMALQPRKFDWKDGKGSNTKNARGFIAQELEQVFPDLIDEWRDPAPEGEDPYKSVRQDLIPVLVKAMQEQQALIIQLQADVAALKAAA